MHVLISPDALLPLPSGEVARALAQAWLAEHTVTQLPMSDGSSGFVECIRTVRGGELIPIPVRAPHRLAQGDVPAELLHVPGRSGGTAYVDAASLLASQDNARALATGTTAPVADLLCAALDTGAGRIVIALAQAAVHDGGSGLLNRLAQEWGVVQAGGLPDIAALRARLRDVRIEVAASSGAPLLGLTGAGAELARLPGLTAELAQQAERGASEFVAAVQRTEMGPAMAGLDVMLQPALRSQQRVRASRDFGTGAGGGAAYALALLGARIMPGGDVLGAEIGLVEAVEHADLVITATHTLDGAAMHESVVATVGRAAMECGAPVVAVGADVQVSRRDGARVGVSATYPIQDEPITRGRWPIVPAIADPRQALRIRGERIYRTWSQ